MTQQQRIQNYLNLLYGEAETRRIWPLLAARLEAFAARPGQAQHKPASLNERDAILITYGDQFIEPGCLPLQTLSTFASTHLQDTISGIHILPFYPSTSDDGFSVVDYKRIDPQLGTWDDVAKLGKTFRLMFDAVINHMSQSSEWFQAFKRGESPYEDYFIDVDPDIDLSAVVRPRALPLLTSVETSAGTKYVWTTFSADQIDLNYASPDLMLEIIDVLMYYVEQGAEMIRLDAIAYLWKEIGTPCIHLRQTHIAIKLWRAVLDIIAPGTLLITETNVPHEDNISYFGQFLPETGTTDEAQLVYNFSLAPLVLHSFLAGDAGKLSAWASGLRTPKGALFFNFIASHDGIGVMPARDILSDREIQQLVECTVAHGGQVSYKSNPDGSQSVYELNTTLYDFLNDPKQPDSENDVKRFLASQAILLSLAGLPGIYVHSLFGSRNCEACFKESGRARSLNREKFSYQTLQAMLADPATHQGQIFTGYRHLLRMRGQHPAFHPESKQSILDLHPALFAVVRQSASDPTSIVVCLINVSDQPVRLSLGDRSLAPHRDSSRQGDTYWQDILTGAKYPVQEGQVDVPLTGYQVVWLSPESNLNTDR